MMTATEIIDLLNLKPLPFEGGFFRQTYESNLPIPESILPERYDGDRKGCTAIYYLLTAEKECFSALHKLTTDEIWHFYCGYPVEMLLLSKNGTGETVILGTDILNGQAVQKMVPNNTWHGARLLNHKKEKGGHNPPELSHVSVGEPFALMGTTMAPGFTIEDYTHGNREELLAEYPAYADQILRLTRGNQ